MWLWCQGTQSGLSVKGATTNSKWKRREKQIKENCDLGTNLNVPAAAAAAAKSLQSCPTLWDPTDGSPPGSPVPGILQARTLEWVAISFSNTSKWKVKLKLLSRDPMDCSLPGSSIHGSFQAGVLEWGATAFFGSLFLYKYVWWFLNAFNRFRKYFQAL